MNPIQHPIQAAEAALGSAGVDPRLKQKATLFNGANSGPAQVAAQISGYITGMHTGDDAPYYTTQEGIPIPDNQHPLNVGGIPVVSDIFLFQKQQTFNRAKTLERMVHPCGSGAFGEFEVTHDVSHLTKAGFLSQVGRKTPVFTRFSTVTFGREFPDQGRNPRGMAMKFYTNEGNYDIVGLNWPIFFVRDPMQGPDLIRSQQRDPKKFTLNWEATFDFLANCPEANHAGMMFFSDHGTPVGWRHNAGFGCHTFKWVNKEGQFVYIKYTFLPEHGTKQFTYPEAIQKCGEDPDYSKRDLWDAIENHDYPVWKAYVQVMAPEQADPAILGFDPFDVTKVWPRKQFPLQEFGKLTLNKNPDNYHRDVEQAAFSPGSMVPGIEPSPDTLLQWRCFFYRDAQYHRLGVNLHQIPVNCPFLAGSYSTIMFDGEMRTDANIDSKKVHRPNSFGDQDKFRPDTREAPIQMTNSVLSRDSHFYHEGRADDYDQARELYTRVMKPQQRENLHKNTVHHLKEVTPMVQKAYLAQCCAIEPSYARSIYDLLPGNKEFDFSEVEELAKDAHWAGKKNNRILVPQMKHNRLVGGYPAEGMVSAMN